MPLFSRHLSGEETDCLPSELQDGRMATNALTSGKLLLSPTEERILREVLKCLSQDNIVRFIMAGNAGARGGVSEDSINCPIKALATTDLETTMVPSKIPGGPENALMTGMAAMIAASTVAGYCLSDEEWAALEPATYPDGDRDILHCIVDAHGGPRSYAEAIMSVTGEGTTILSEAHDKCDAAGEQDQPQATEPENREQEPPEGAGHGEDEEEGAEEHGESDDDR